MKRIIFLLLMFLSLLSYSQETPNKLQLISPLEKGKLESALPVFRWNSGSVQAASYTFTLLELPIDSRDSLKKPDTLYVQRGIKDQFLKYAENFPKIDLTKAYAWQVTAFDRRELIAATSDWFFLPPIFLPFNFCWFFPLSPAQQDICLGNPVQFQALLISFPGSGITNWTLKNLTTGTIQTGSQPSGSITVAPPPPITPGVYTYQLSMNSGTCSGSAIFTVNVYPNLQNANIISGGSINGTNICYGRSAQLVVPGYTGNASDLKWEYSDDNGASYTFWANGNNVNTNSIRPNCSNIATQFVKRIYRVSYNAPGMTAPPSCAQGSVSVNVYCPTIGGTMTSTLDQFCLAPGQSSIPVTFTVTGNRGTITWPPGGTGSGNSRTYTCATGITTINAIIQNGPCNPVTISKTVEVFAPISCSASASRVLVCPNDDAVVSVSYLNAGANPQIQWQYTVDDNDNNCTNNNPNPWVNSGTGPQQNTNEIGGLGPYNPVPVNNITWRVIVTNTNYTGTNPACKSCTSCVRINIIPKICTPTIQLVGANPKCEGAAIQLNANFPAGCSTAGLTYQWFLDGDAVSGVSNNSTFTGTLPGNYQLQVNGPCESVLSSILTIKDCVFDLAIKGPCCSSPGKKVSFTVTDTQGGNNLSSCGGTYQYQWRVAGAAAVIGTGQSVSVAPLTTTTYEVTVTDSKGCQSKITVTLLVCP